MKVPWLKALNKDEPCLLCRDGQPRLNSHVIPKFVFRHASVRAPNNYLRTTFNPNVREQDGLKEYMLCAACEQRFSKWENSFARIFRDHYADPGQNITYTNEDALAALSILWRVAAHAMSHPENGHLELGKDYSRIEDGFERWRRVLLGQESHPGEFRTFWMFMNYATGRGAADSGFNRHVFHAINFDLLASKKRSFVLVHLPGMYIVGALEPTPRNVFRGVDISYKGGKYIARERKVMADFVLESIQRSIAQANEAFDGISEKQKDKIILDAVSDPERALKSALFRTYLHDQSQ